MGQPERIRTLPSDGIEEIRVLSQGEIGNGGRLPRESVDCNVYFLAAVKP